MRSCLSLVLTLALATTSSVARAGWTREQRATLDRIIKLENAAIRSKDAVKLATAVERYEQESARADAPNGYRRAVAKRGKAAALELFAKTKDSSHLCTALRMFRIYQADLMESEEDRREIPTDVAALEAQAVEVGAPCALIVNSTPPPSTEGTQDRPPASAAVPSTGPSQDPPAPAAAIEGPHDRPAAWPSAPRRSRGQIAAGVSLLGAAAGFGAGMAACYAARPPEDARIAALEQRATDAGRELTEGELMQVHAADDRYVLLSNGGKALGVFAGVGLLAAVIVLAIPPKNTVKIRARAMGGGVHIAF